MHLFNMKTKKIFPYAVLVVLLFSIFSGCIKKEYREIILPSASASFNDNPKYKFSSYYQMKEIKIHTSMEHYKLPLNLRNVENMDTVENEFNLTEKQKDFLKENGFVIVDYGKIDDISKVYTNMIANNIPIFITSDTLLHLYHIQFNEILKAIEEREFFDNITEISRAMLEKSKDDYAMYDNNTLKEAARRNVAFFAVALAILQENIKLPSYVKKEVNEELKHISEHSGFEESAIFHYIEDYSQYLPRGHYTQSEKLKRYFKAMMWYGRMAFLIRGSDIISEKDAKIATLQAILISIDLTNVSIGGKKAEEIWERIYSITSFFVGAADDLTPYEYIDSIRKVFGSNFDVAAIINETNILNFRAQLANLRSPQIYGGTGNVVISPPFTEEKLKEAIDKTKGMRFMGQRFIPDSYMFQQLVFPMVGMYNGSMDKKPFTMEMTYAGATRCFPRGLDVMAVLGSDRAVKILEEEGDTSYSGENKSYYKQLNFLRAIFNGMNLSQWNHNLYFSWLYTLKSLIKEFNESYPSFMQTKAWKDKELQTSLASWTELRHDTILYAKQSYTYRISMPPLKTEGYVEPVPEFYSRMAALVNMTLNGLKSFNAINESEENRLIKLEKILQNLLNISINELEGKEIDGAFFNSFVDELNETMRGLNKEAKKTTMVADVHTDTNTNKCLEEGVGYIDLILVAYGNKKISIAGGAVLSYYEFKQPINNRLTDEEWEKMIDEMKMAPWQEEIHP